MVQYQIDELTQRALSVGVLSQQQIQDIWSHFGTSHIESDAFLQAAVRLGFLTGYQVERLSSDDSFGFFYGDYKALYIVGAGTFARVFRATHRTTGEIAAVKVLRARFSDNKEFIEHFLHEAKLGTQLKHPNIVPIHSASSEGYLHYMVMEFIEGQTLREFVKLRKKVDAKTATLIVRDIASGLEYALRRGLQHRDLKLSNVMLSSTGQAKLVDFGLAAIAEKADVSVPFLRNQQSVDYIALEKCGASRNDARSDLYFLGCMYYQMLCGESPFPETKDRTKRLDRNRFYNVKPLQQVDSSIPFEVSRLVGKAMQVDPGARYQSPTMMIFDLNKALERLEEGAGSETQSTAVGATNAGSTSGNSTTEMKRGVMLVDSNEAMQNLMRDSLKKAGFRALILSSPERAIDRLADDEGIVHCVVFNATSLGLRAIKGFNEAGSRRGMKNLPCILLLDENQGSFAAEAQQAPHRLVMQMPITIRKLRETISRLITDNMEQRITALAGNEK